jgi:hypothetical protein
MNEYPVEFNGTSAAELCLRGNPEVSYGFIFVTCLKFWNVIADVISN